MAKAPMRLTSVDHHHHHQVIGHGVVSERVCRCPPVNIVLPKRRHQSILSALAPSEDGHSDGSPHRSGPLRTAMATALISSALLANAFPAQAREWHARRHHRRIKDGALDMVPKITIPARARKLEEKDITASKDVLSSQTTAAAVQDGIGDLLLQAKRAYRKTRRALNGNDAAVYQVGVSGRRDIPSYTYGSSPSRTQEASPLGWLAVALAVGGIAIAVWQRRNSNGMFPFWGGLRGRQEGGRWIRDRSLGGKMIFIPDGSFSSSSASASSSSRPAPRPLWEDDDEFSSDLADAAAAATTSSAAVGTGTANDIPVRDTTPVWYAPPAPASYVSAERKQEMARQAKAALRDLEDAKILRGEDYSLSGMVTLRKACHLGGGLTVRASTESGRDAILRAAVRAGIEESLRSVNPATALGGYEPGRFVSGIASDLGVPEKRTITIVHAEVAATCRSSLIDAEAAYRARNESDLLRALRKMVLTLAAFPLPRGSAEAELVGRSLLKQATLEFRRAAFLGAGSADLATAPLVAEMLGFDPDLVMTELITKIAAAGTAVPGSEAAGP